MTGGDRAPYCVGLVMHNSSPFLAQEACGFLGLPEGRRLGTVHAVRRRMRSIAPSQPKSLHTCIALQPPPPRAASLCTHPHSPTPLRNTASHLHWAHREHAHSPAIRHPPCHQTSAPAQHRASLFFRPLRRGSSPPQSCCPPPKRWARCLSAPSATGPQPCARAYAACHPDPRRCTLPTPPPEASKGSLGVGAWGALRSGPSLNPRYCLQMCKHEANVAGAASLPAVVVCPGVPAQ